MRLPSLSGPRARGCRRVYRRCRQFWSNICPRKNKSPLSLTTGRASLVSNRALLNRRRITDPRVARPFRLLSAPSFRSRSTSPIVVSSSADLFFFFSSPLATEWGDVARRCRYIIVSGIFIENFIVVFTVVYFYRRYSVPSFLSRSRLSVEDHGQARLKSRAPTKNAGRDCLVRTRVSTHQDFADLSRFLCYRVILPVKNEKLQIHRSDEKKNKTRPDRFWIVKSLKEQILIEMLRFVKIFSNPLKRVLGPSSRRYIETQYRQNVIEIQPNYVCHLKNVDKIKQTRCIIKTIYK